MCWCSVIAVNVTVSNKIGATRERKMEGNLLLKMIL